MGYEQSKKPSSSGASLLVGETVLQAPAASISVAGLDLDAHFEYEVSLVFENTTNADVNLVLNDDNTSSRYSFRRMYQSNNGTNTGQQGDSSQSLGTLFSTATVHLLLNISKLASKMTKGTYELSSGSQAGTNFYHCQGAFQYNQTTNITKIGFTAGANFPAGTILRVKKRS